MPDEDKKPNKLLELLAGDYGMLLVLLGLCVFFALVTLRKEGVEGAEGGKALAAQIISELGSDAEIFIASGESNDEVALAKSLEKDLAAAGITIAGQASGKPPEIAKELRKLDHEIDAIAAPPAHRTQQVYDKFSGEGKIAKQLMTPSGRTVSPFLSLQNLRNIASQNAVIAIIGIGMTMVIITAGIDLSVGSLVALSTVICALIIQQLGGSGTAPGIVPVVEPAGVFAMLLAALVGILACALVGAFTGWMVAGFCVPPFIATLAMMQVIRGSGLVLSESQTISDIPASFQWLGTGLTFGIPNCVILMAVLYIIAHVVMTKTKLGRYIYATGGNPEAARLSGVSPKKIKLTVYIIAGALAGLAGIVLASQLKGGAGKFGEAYELKVIAAVVVGGTSLFGGRGKVFGTLIGALIIAVIGNGMNLTGLGSEKQMIVLGAVILLAVLIERFRSGEWKSAVGG